MASNRAILAVGLLAAVLCPALSTRSFISMPADHSSPVTLGNGLSYDYHAQTCPQLRDMVRPLVRAALQSEIALAAGLLRIFFHDCFPQGCDASLLLTGPNSERDMPPNQTLQPRAMQLVEDIRVQVHAACGATVSCADIIAMATSEAVYATGGMDFGYAYDVPLGRFDSLAPAPSNLVLDLPRPTSDASTLISAFQTRNLEVQDLVALSGAHTVGKAHCGSFSDRFSEDADFARRLAANCSTDQNRLQDLDVNTPNTFDNRYFANLVDGKGVFTSDKVLAGDGRTSWLVNGFAGNKWWFYGQFGASMTKLSQIGDNKGEIRRNSCFRTNAQSIQAAAASDEGFAASA